MKGKKASLTTQELGMYSGQECLIGEDTKRFFVLDGVVYLPSDHSGGWVSEDGAVTPILRSLDSMTAGEARDFIDKDGGLLASRWNSAFEEQYLGPCPKFKPEGFLWLITNGFDAFGWIKKGLAIEKTTT